MKSRTTAWLFWSLLVLAAVGLVVTFRQSPSAFLFNLLIGLMIFGVLFFLFRRLSPGVSGGGSSKEQRAYRKAVRSSKKRRQTTSPLVRGSHVTSTKAKRSTTKKRKPPSHLTVIEGNKNKKKDRASL